jgi:hypothetical protein
MVYCSQPQEKLSYEVLRTGCETCKMERAFGNRLIVSLLFSCYGGRWAHIVSEAGILAGSRIWKLGFHLHTLLFFQASEPARHLI